MKKILNFILVCIIFIAILASMIPSKTEKHIILSASAFVPLPLNSDNTNDQIDKLANVSEVE
jgi:hypothetical protein